MALDLATSELVAAMRSADGKPLHESQPEEVRQGGGMLSQMIGPGPDLHRSTDHSLKTPDGAEFTVRVLVPHGQPDAVILYFHGGGWVTGNIDEWDTLGRQLATRSNCTVAMVNYRKAPEFPYPSPVEDAWLSLVWAHENLVTLAGGPVPLVVAGDSAGGNLAAVVAQRAVSRSGPELALQVLVYPVTDADQTTVSYLDPENQVLLTAEGMAWFWNHYAPESRRGEPEASPLRAVDLRGLPPAVILLAEHDPLRTEGEAYAEALRAADIPVQTHLFEGQSHGFFSMPNLLPGASAGLDYAVQNIRAALESAVPHA
ncbi:alpha/beta hydrolase [Streptomyces sp. NPDC102441]|uniref:alpha/beta hydrolase n=1 Tax=Streptomyces sp. NPDC102441 TaxID=3366176 RepID=UPI003818AC67